MDTLVERCQAVGCPAELSYTPDYDREQGIVQHGPNPEHVIVLTLKDVNWSRQVEAWLGRIHAEG